MTSVTERHTFRDVLAQAAAQAKLLLPAQVNGRIEKAVTLVLHGDVEPHDDGTVTVYSATDATRRYVLQGTSCTCSDFERRQAPDGWCQHKIAANLFKSVARVLTRRGDPAPAPAVILPEEVEVFPDNDIELEEVEPSPQPAPTPLPEAPASVNVRVTISGREVQWTLRGMDELEVLARLERLLARYPVSTPSTSAEPEPEKRYCPTHGTAMQLNHKDGRSWYSHKTADGWCKGQGGRS